MTWQPPRMPSPLLQELHWPDAWRCMVICIMLNCTQRKQVEPMIDRFFTRFPDAVTYCILYPFDEVKAEIVEMIRPLGFYNRRAERIFRFSMDFVYNYRDVREGKLDIRRLYGIGEYAARCYEMLFLGKFGEEPPDDHALADYHNWYVKTHGHPNDIHPAISVPGETLPG